MSRSSADRLLDLGLRTTALLTGAIVVLVAGFVLAGAVPALRSVGPLAFVTDPSWHPTEGTFGLLPMVVGTAVVTLGAVLVATPLGVLSALFCAWYAPDRVAGPYRRLIEVLAGVPSVVFGFWGLVVLVPLIAALRPPGTSLLAGVLIVGLMVLPTVALLSASAIEAVPADLVMGARALGLGTAATIRGVVLPAARSGILASIFLATARAIGETMAVLMICGNVVQIPSSAFDPVRTLTANIALEMAYAMGDHRSALFVSGLVLITGVVGLVLVADRSRGLLRV